MRDNQTDNQTDNLQQINDLFQSFIWLIERICRSGDDKTLRAITSNIEAYHEVIDSRQEHSKFVAKMRESSQMHLEFKEMHLATIGEMNRRLDKLQIEMEQFE